MLDRLLSGAGAVSHLADRIVRIVFRGPGAATRPVGLVLAALLAIGAASGVVIAAENSGDRTLHQVAAGDLASGEPGDRTYATVTGGVASAYIETFRDLDEDGKRSPDEKGLAWDYFLVDPSTRKGVTVLSDRPPTDVYAYEAKGVVVDDSEYVAEDLKQFQAWLTRHGVTLEPSRYIDTTQGGTFTPFELAGTLPVAGTAVDLHGARAVDYVTVCSADTNSDGVCSPDEVDRWDVLLYDPVSAKGITVLTDQSPEFAPASFTGLLRRSPERVADAQRMDNGTFAISDLGVTLSTDYLLDDGTRPTEPLSALAIALLLGAIALVIVVGAFAGPVRFRLDPPGVRGSPRITMAAGERVPIHVTGTLRSARGLTRVREAAADLVRFVMAPVPAVVPVAPQQSDAVAPSPDAVPPPADAVPPPDPTATGPSAAEVGPIGVPSSDAMPEAAPVVAAPAVPAATADAPPVAPETTLIVERHGKPEGVAIGRGELRGIEIGTVIPFRGSRPALRLTAGTGTLLVSFDTREARDRAAAELAAESGS